MSNVLFELPLHPIGEKRVAILSVTDTLYQTINLDEMGLDSLPEVLILDDCRYRYAGIEYGRGVYRKEDEEIQAPPDDLDVQIVHEFQKDLLECIPGEALDNAIRNASNGLGVFDDDDYLDDISESLVRSIEYYRRFPYGQCNCVGTHHTPEAAIASGKTILYGSVTADPSCPVCHGTGAAPEPGPPLVHNQAHNPACMQCERCQSLTKKLAEMLENPPGFKGIKVGSEHYGNKYIDFGWVEAVRVVQSLIVPHVDGTTEEISPSLVDGEDLP